ncbi:competence protein ComF [Sorangium cellulosum]|uniref:Competence protein ComF n=1 Tax=Sorangium cellulosum TaxID=56 RepID=A0A4P2Q9N1_SORCE|nr:ComF family protein [Sorangium cellulosum]AUX25946.1 competence protein ComF [Sorangium cellulosum]
MIARRTLAAALRALAAAAARALSPPACAGCDAFLAEAAVFCAGCARTVAPWRPARAGCLPRGAIGSSSAADAALVAFAPFAGALADGIRRFKYGDRPDLARPLGRLLLCAAREAGVGADVVVPVPLHPRRLAERGYNQAALLAAHIAGGLGAKLAPRALCRVRSTAQQAQLPRELRLQNVAGAFRVRAPERVRGRRIALVDDVATTGATLAACHDALLGAGVASVTCLVLASTEGGVDDLRSSPRSAPRT